MPTVTSVLAARQLSHLVRTHARNRQAADENTCSARREAIFFSRERSLRCGHCMTPYLRHSFLSAVVHMPACHQAHCHSATCLPPQVLAVRAWLHAMGRRMGTCVRVYAQACMHACMTKHERRWLCYIRSAHWPGVPYFLATSFNGMLKCSRSSRSDSTGTRLAL